MDSSLLRLNLWRNFRGPASKVWASNFFSFTGLESLSLCTANSEFTLQFSIFGRVIILNFGQNNLFIICFLYICWKGDWPFSIYIYGRIEENIADSSQLNLLLSLLSRKKFLNKKINVIILIYICFCQHRILRRPNLYVL